MLNICLCDDEKDTLEYYSNKICNLLSKHNYAFRIDSFSSGESLIFDLEENPNKFNIIIMDILMNDTNGIETTKILRNYGYNGVIIFLTSSKEFALESFEVEPLNYILKNDSDDRFNTIMLKACELVCSNVNKSIMIPSKKYRNRVINLDEIVYMESLNKKVMLHKIDGEVEEVNCVLKDIYNKVQKYGFIRCHKSYIVNGKYVNSFNNIECILKKDIIIPIGRKYSKDFKKLILENEFDNLLI